MDQATQQNAALVEEMAAAASSLRGQAQDLVQAVSAFRLDAGVAAQFTPAPTRSAAALPKAQPSAPKLSNAASAKPVQSPLATATTPPQVASGKKADDGEWETF
jgi:methyl-accepting chemotaxis protein